MLTPNKKIHTAVQAVLYIACAGADMPVRSKEICAYQGVTLRYLEQILQQLVRDKILRGVRGPKGGYVLARDRRKVTVADIHHSIVPLLHEETLADNDVATVLMGSVERELLNSLQKSMSNTTIQQLYDHAKQQQIDIIRDQSADFII